MMKKVGLVTLFLVLNSVFLFGEKKYLLVDNMNRFKNSLGGKCGMYMQSPSKIHFIKPFKLSGDKKYDRVLKIRWIKKDDGGPFGKGGWCGYYTILKVGRKYLDLAKYKYLVFNIKGAKGDEDFTVGLADKTYEKIDDSYKAKPVSKYLNNKKVTTKWQTVKIPLTDFFIELNKVYSLSINFVGKSRGTVYIDNIKFEK